MALSVMARSFLQSTDWHLAEAQALPYDMSDRRYWRLVGGPRPALLMVSTAAHEPIGPYIRVADHLRALGVSAPDILAADAEAGFAIVEDFGSGTFNAHLQAGEPEGHLYMLAVDVLAHIHTHPRAGDVDCPPYDQAALLRELDVFAEWFLPHATSVGDWTVFRAAFARTLDDVAENRSALVLRDFHIDNLMVLEGRTGVQACGLLDFQDALIGAPAYDVMSLIEDARRDVSDTVYEAAIARYLRLVPSQDETALRRDIAILGLQRHLKVIGVFTRYYQRTGRTKYLAHLVRLAGMVERCFAHSSLAPLLPLFSDACPNLAGDCRRMAALNG